MQYVYIIFLSNLMHKKITVKIDQFWNSRCVVFEILDVIFSVVGSIVVG